MKTFDPAALRAQFPLLTGGLDGGPLHYLDNGATSQLPQTVIDAVIRFETTSRANVLRSVHRLAEAATDAYEGARLDIARYLNVPGDEIVFTSGTTSAINLVARSFGESLQPGDEIVLSLLEHHGNFVPWQMLRDRRGIALKILPVTAEGRIDLSALERTISKRTKLIALAHVSNVTGAVLDVVPVVAAARTVGAKVLLDGAQRTPHGPLDLPGLGVDFYAFSGHKMFGPTGIGVLWARRALLDAMPPLMGGGEMIRTVTLERTEWADVPHKFEAGTPPIAQAVGLGAAVRWLMALDWAAASAHEMRLTQRVLDGLGRLKGARVIGPSGLQGRAPVISFDLAGAHPHDVCQILDGFGVALRGGHHCAQPLMNHFGVAGTTRASLALYNNDADVDALLSGLETAAAKLQ
jgi:cysteine desulfurase / selenocysteine lyase